MELVSVASSNIAAIGYSAECRLLRVRYLDGSTYDHPDVDPIEHETLMAAHSKGRYIALLAKRKPGTRLGGKTVTLREPAKPGLTQTFEPDDCCGQRLARVVETLAETDSWTCPECGCEWRPRIVGVVRHWEPHEVIDVIR